MKKISFFFSLSLCTAMLLGCGGDGNANKDSSSKASTPASVLAAASSTLPNVQALVVDRGPKNAKGVSVGLRNASYVSVTVCQPGSSSKCQSIDHVLLDTGSSGLRLLASTLPTTFVLPAVVTTEQKSVAECGQFANSFTWGAVRQADVRMGGELAKAISVQIIGDNAFPSVPASCSSGLPPANSVDSLHANGLMGISTFLKDCGLACVDKAQPGTYYVCEGLDCNSVALPLAQQLGNPVADFDTDNNGTLITLPAIEPNGSSSVKGSLTFGISTQPNNRLGGAAIYTLNSSGNMSTLYKGRSLESFLDSGSNSLFFADSDIKLCNTGFYCPPATLSLSAINSGTNGQNGTINFSVANADELFHNSSRAQALNNLAGLGPISSYFDWGLPFYFGRTVYTAIEGRMAGAFVGPFVAY